MNENGPPCLRCRGKTIRIYYKRGRYVKGLATVAHNMQEIGWKCLGCGQVYFDNPKDPFKDVIDEDEPKGYASLEN